MYHAVDEQATIRLAVTAPCSKLTPFLRPRPKRYKPTSERFLLGGQPCEPPAFLREARLVVRIVHVGQPNHVRPKAPLALCGSIPGNTIARGTGTNFARTRRNGFGCCKLSSRRSGAISGHLRASGSLGNPCAGQLRSDASQAHKETKTQCEFCCRRWLSNDHPLPRCTTASGRGHPNEPARIWTMLRPADWRHLSIHPRAQRRARGGRSTAHWAIDAPRSVGSQGQKRRGLGTRHPRARGPPGPVISVLHGRRRAW